MKKTNLIFIIILLLTVTFTATGMDLSVGVTWDLSLRLGLAIDITPQLALKGSVGPTLFSLEGDFALCYDLMLIYALSPQESQWNFGICAGLMDGMFVFASPQATLHSFGAGFLAGYNFTDSFGLRLRAGAGYPLFTEGSDVSPGDDDFPLGLWPDFGLEAVFKL